jgi:leader peptidase (prepilin peptidase)/N-methyltransferase
MLYLMSCLFGLVTGSFANVCILRLPKDQSLLGPRSHCPHCHRSLRTYHNIPVLSFLFLRGQCAYCQKPISWQYPAVEFIMGCLFVFHTWMFKGYLHQMIIADILSFYLLTLSIIDFRHRIIPDELSLSLIVLGVFSSFANPYFPGLPWQRVLWSLGSAVAGGLLMLLMAWIGEKTFKKEALGGGDIKLIAGTAAVLGWPGIFGPLFIGSMGGGLCALLLLILKKKKLGETLPFGPFLSLGAYWTCLFPAWYTFLIH